MASDEPKQTNKRWFSILAALYPAGLLFLYIPLDMAARNTEIFVPDGAWFVGLGVGFLTFWMVCSWLVCWALKEPDTSRSGMRWAVLIGIVTVCQWAAFQPVIGRQPLAVALILDVAVLAAVWALFRFIAVRHLLNLMGLGGAVVLIAVGHILWFTSFLSDVKMGSSQRPRSSMDTYHRELAPPATTETSNVYHILLDGFQKEFVGEALRRAGVEEGLKDFDVLDTLITDSWSTHWSMAFLMAGRVLKDGESWMEFERQAFQEGLADSLHRRGMRIYQYVSHPYQCLKGKSYCRDAKEFASSRVGHWPLVDLSFLNILPGSLRQLLEGHAIRKTNTWSYDFSLTSLFGREKNIAPDDIPAFSNRIVAGASEDEIKRTEKGNYVYLHLLNPHQPWILDKNCKYRGRDWNTSREMILGQHACALRQLAQFVTALKETGHYANSLIVVHADHGNLTVNGIIDAGMADFVNFPIEKNEFTPNKVPSDQAPQEDINVTTAGILLIKMPEGDSNILKNESDVQYPDIYRLIVESVQAEMPEHLKSETKEPRVLLTRAGSFFAIPERFAQFIKEKRIGWKFKEWVVPSDGGQSWIPESTDPHFIKSYKGYSLNWTGSHFVALEHGRGAVDLFQSRVGDFAFPPYVFRGNSRAAVKKQIQENSSSGKNDYVIKEWGAEFVGVQKDKGFWIQEYVGERSLPPYIKIGSAIEELESWVDGVNIQKNSKTPLLIKQDDQLGYNVVAYSGKIYGVPFGVKIDWDSIEDMPEGVLMDEDIDALEKRMAEEVRHQSEIEPTPKIQPPRMLKPWANHNILAFNDYYCAVRHGVEVNWTALPPDIPGAACYRDVEAAYDAARRNDTPLPVAKPPQLIESYKRFNIVAFQGRYMAVRHGIALDWGQSEQVSKLRRAFTVADLKAQLD